VIKRIASCPYCRNGEVAFDCDLMELILNPDGAAQQPCEHLLCLDGFYCRARVFRSGARQVGFAKVHWQRPGLDALASQEIRRRLQERAASEPGGGAPRGEPVCQLDSIGWEGEEHLSQAETARWLDEVGWDKAEELEVPSLEYRLEGWIGFAQRPTDLFPLPSGDQIPLAG
jgi:hypothetical protein